MEPQPNNIARNATIAILLVSNVVTASYYAVAEAPLPVEKQIRYEKIDETHYNKVKVHVSNEENLSVDEIQAQIELAEAKIAEFSGNPAEAERLRFAEEYRDEMVEELEQLRAIGIEPRR